jgi:hypothetical protein
MALFNSDDKELSQGDVGEARDGNVLIKEDVYAEFDIPGSLKPGRQLKWAAGRQIPESEIEQEFKTMRAIAEGDPYARVPGDSDTAASVTSAPDTANAEEGGHLVQRDPQRLGQEADVDSDMDKAQRASAEKETGVAGGDSGDEDKDDQKSTSPRGRAGQAQQKKYDK